MPTYTMSMTQRSQVTVPSAVRRVLGLGPRDRIAFDVQGDVVTLRPAVRSFSFLAGSVPPFPGHEDRLIEQYIRDANEDHADHVADEGR